METLASLALPKFPQPRVLCAGPRMASARRTLARARFSVATVNDGAEAWSALLANPFDLVVARVGLPTLDGIRLIQRARLAGINAPVIFLSDVGDPFTVSERRRLRVAAILGRHCRASALLAAVKHSLTFFGGLLWKPRRL
jgi:DNA-binding response OmpR family regulator